MDGSAELNVTADPIWKILWSNGDTTNNTIFFDEETAQLKLNTSLGCLVDFIINLPTIPNVDNLPFLPDTSINSNENLHIHLQLDPNEWSVAWYPDNLFECPSCLNTSFVTDISTQIAYTIIHKEGCQYSDSFYVFINEIKPSFYIPNVFSPNGDGQNDKWHIFSENFEGKFLNLEVFDRWGNIVHKASGLENLDWDGSHNGRKLSSGIYAYKLIFQPQHEPINIICGDLTLVR